MQLDPFYTASRVHHLVMLYESDELAINPFETAFVDYLRQYRPIPFRFQELQQGG